MMEIRFSLLYTLELAMLKNKIITHHKKSQKDRKSIFSKLRVYIKIAENPIANMLERSIKAFV